MRLSIIVLLLATLGSLSFAQTPTPPNKASVKPTATPAPAKADPLNLTEVEALNVDKNQQQEVALKEEAGRIQVHINEAAEKIQTAKNTDAMAAAGYQMRDALLEDFTYRGKLKQFKEATEALVQGIRTRYQEQTGQDGSSFTINVSTKRLEPPQASSAQATIVTQGANASPPEAKPKQ